MLLLEPIEPLRPLLGGEGGAPFLGEHEEVRGVRLSRSKLLAAVRELLQRILADRLEHQEAGLTAARLPRLKEALVHEGADARDHVEAQVPIRIGHGLRGLEGEAAGEGS